MVGVAQMVRASDCDSEGRGFDPRLSPQTTSLSEWYYIGEEDMIDVQRVENAHLRFKLISDTFTFSVVERETKLKDSDKTVLHWEVLQYGSRLIFSSKDKAAAKDLLASIQRMCQDLLESEYDLMMNELKAAEGVEK
jgi:hypothetical protein